MTRRKSLKLTGGALLALFAGVKLVESDDEEFERKVRNGPVRNSTFNLRKQHVFKNPIYIEKCTFATSRSQGCFLSRNAKHNATITILGGDHYFCNNIINLNPPTSYLNVAA